MPLSPTDSILPKRQKASKGKVVVYVLESRLRLRWSVRNAQGQLNRFSFAVGSDNALNRMAAERLALQIEMDIASQNFDETLSKYRPQVPGVVVKQVLVLDLLRQFIQAKQPELAAKSLEKYQILENHLQVQVGQMKLSDFTEKQAEKFVASARERKLKGETINAYLVLLRAVWDWAVKRKLVNQNPWSGLRVKQEPHPRPKPFSHDEVDRILKAFNQRPFAHYRNFVFFVVSTGCRPSEAIGLSWDSIKEDCSEVWIGTSYSLKEKRVKSTKTNKARDIPISKSIQTLLQSLKPEQPEPKQSVFLAPKGGYIDLHTFTSRVWTKALLAAEVPYRPFYNTRHSQWTKEVVGGMDIATAAYLAGNTPRTMLNRYLGTTKLPTLKDWFNPDDGNSSTKTDA